MQRIGQFQLLEKLGPSQECYRALEVERGREVAIYLFPRARELTERILHRVQRQVGALIDLRHGNLLRVHEVGAIKGVPFLVTGLQHGESLAERLSRGPLPEGEAAALALKLALALHYLHAHNLIHRNVCAESVVVEPGGEPVLGGYGLLRDLDPEETGVGATGLFMGTPGYWSPEQAGCQADRISPASDMYGLGATLYAMLVGSPPGAEFPPTEQIAAALRHRPRTPSELRPGLDPALEAICLKCLAKDPSERYQSAGVLADELSLCLRGDPSSPAARAVTPQRVAVAALLLVIFVLGALIASLGPQRAEEQPAPSGSPEGDLPRSEPSPVAETTPTERRLETPPPPSLRPVAPGPPPSASGGVTPLSGQALAAFNQGMARFRRGYHVGALEDFSRALELSPDYAPGYLQRAIVHTSLGDYQAAVDDCTRALELQPAYPQALSCRGLAYTRLEQGARAIADLERALELAPEIPHQEILRRELRRLKEE